MKGALLALALLAFAAQGLALEARWSIRRLANLPDGAPAFEIVSPKGAVVSRVECIANGWFDPDTLAASFMSAPRVMAAVIAKAGQLAIEDLGPATFNCTVIRPPA